jgi:hypothetical protein
MSILRTQHSKEMPYVMLNKKALEDPNLSWAAKGLWAYLMSRPDDWNVSVAHLCKIYNAKGGGRDSIYSLLSELEKYGYCHKKQLKSEKGQFTKFEYIITEFQKILPLTAEPDPAEPLTAEPATNNERTKPKKENIFKDDQRITSKVTESKDDFVDRGSSSQINCDSFSKEDMELSDQIDRLGNLTFVDGSKIKPPTALSWLKKYEFPHIQKAFEYYLKMIKLTKTKKKNHEAYLQDILDNCYWQKKEKKDYVLEQINDHEERKQKDREYWEKRK